MSSFRLQLFGVLAFALGQGFAGDSQGSNLRGSTSQSSEKAYCCFWCSAGGCSAEYSEDAKDVPAEAGACVKGGTITPIPGPGSHGYNCGKLVPQSLQLSSSPQCVAADGVCGGPGLHTETCCGNAKCTSLLGGGVMKCIEEQPQCVPRNAECGGPGRHTETCCGNAKCTSLLGGGVMKCVEEQQHCVPRDGECGGPGRHTETCCGSAKCTSLVGGGVMKCVEVQQLVQEGDEDETEDVTNKGEAANLRGSTAVDESMALSSKLQCVPSNGECGGRGRHTETCCGNAKCTSLLGGGVMKCVETQPQCVPPNGECGGPGRHTETCCGSAQCTSLLGGGVMKCVEMQPQCVPPNGECGGPGRHTKTCCGNAKCTSLVGGGVMKCFEKQP